MPERVKYRKMHRGSRAGMATRGQTVAFGEYGLMALERCWLDTKQIEAARVAVARNMKRHGKMWIRVFPQKSFTKKPLETRMGKGKAPVEGWVAVGGFVAGLEGREPFFLQAGSNTISSPAMSNKRFMVVPG